MAGLGGIVALLVKNAVKSAVKFELAIDPIIARFESQCPPKNELDKILQQKNQLSQAITQIETSLTSLSDTGNTIDNIVTGVKAGVTLIKTLPVPTSVPPGVGIPLNIINGFSDTLDILGVLLKEFGGVTSQISPSLEIITKTLSTVNSKLSVLDGLLAGCLQSETEDMTDLEKEEFFQSLGIDLSSQDTTGSSNNPNNSVESENTDVNETLESRLSPNSNNPIIYKGFTITLDNDAGNQFSFPSRRAMGVNGEGVKIVTPFSFSSSTQVLVDAIKFQIDQTDSLELARLANESRLEEIEIEENYGVQKIRAGFDEKFFKGQILFTSKQKAAFQSRDIPEIIKLYEKVISAYESLIEIDPAKARIDRIEQKIVKLGKDLDKAKFDFTAFQRAFDAANTSTFNSDVGKTTSFTGLAGGASGGSKSNSYNPIGRKGSVNGEVVFRGGQAWRFLGGTPDKWVKHTISYIPFSSGGGNKTEFREKTIKTGTKIQRDTYRWDPLFQKWTFVSSSNL